MAQETSKLELLREGIRTGKLGRRAVLKRAVALGLSAPVIASLLAACGNGGGGGATATSRTGGGGTTPTTGGAATTPTTGGAMTTPTTGGMAASPTKGGATASPTKGGAASPTKGGITGTPGKGRGVAPLLRILYWQAPTILNVHLSSGTKDSAASSLVLEPLVDVAADGTLIPVLAAEIPSLENGGVAADGKSVTYKLKSGVVWSDGTPFTADDVRFTWQYTTDPAATTTSIATYEVIQDVQVIDPLTVKILFKDPNPGWYNVFSTGFGGQVVPKHILQNFMGAKARDAEFNLKPIGTGPYVVSEFRPADVVNYAINETYREADKPYFKQVELKGGGDAASAAKQALQTGETDWAWNLQVEKAILEQLAASGQGVLVSTPSANVERILLNFADPNTDVNGAKSEPSTKHPYLSDKAVRQAFAMAADRDSVANQLYGPAGQATANILTGPENFVSKNTSYTFNVAQAGTLLDGAGWVMAGNVRQKDGKQLTGIYQTTINPLRQKTQEIVKAGWQQMGAAIELKSVDAGVFFSSDAGNPDTASHFYTDFEMYTNGPSSPYPISYMASWKSTDPAVDLAQQSNAWAGGNTERWVNADYNKLYQAALIELDPTKQVDLFVGMNDLVVNEVVNIPLVARANVIAANAKLKGYSNSPWSPDVRDIADWYMEG